MPVPSTTGTLKTRIEDMEIGDYIICEYQANSGQVGVFRNLGTSTAPEIPVTGAAAPNGSFYFVKVDKGLLVADRIVQHSISWDTLNVGKVIQGFTTTFEISLVPIMTSDTTPSGRAYASSVTNSSYSAWKAFDGTGSTTYWAGITNTNEWLAYEFPMAKVVKSYAITCQHMSYAPKTWRLEGSQDGSSWVTVDTRSNITWQSVGERKVFSCKSNTTAYKHYRIFVLEVNGASQTYIREFELFENDSIGTLRSLTGGVAYADANGNKSTTDQGFGGWPTNNEWDKYICGFPTDKIQAGKTLDDVFHFINPAPYTWVQDTTINGINGNQGSYASFRNVRGRLDEKYLWYYTSNSVYSHVGFRPVFEYIE